MSMLFDVSQENRICCSLLTHSFWELPEDFDVDTMQLHKTTKTQEVIREVYI